MANSHRMVRRGLRLSASALLLLLIACTPTNQAPTALAIDNTSIAENQPAGTTVGTFATTDPDSGDSHSYSLVAGTGDTDNASFAIAGDELQSAAAFDFESQASYSIRVRTSDPAGGTLERTFDIAVTDEAETTTLTGTVTDLRIDVGINLVAPEVHLVGLNTEALNRLILATRGSADPGGPPPVRGLNAAWLNLLSQQQAGVLMSGQFVVAVGDDGEVLGQGMIAADGSFALTVAQDRPFALFQAREDGGLLCNRVMGYMDLDPTTGKTVHWRSGFFNIASSGATGAPPTELDVGDFAFSEHNASLGGGWSQDPADVRSGAPAGTYQSCGNPDKLQAPVAADFNLATPAGIDGTTLYDFGLALALSYDGAGAPTFLGTGTVGNDGIVNGLNISKITGVDQEMTLVLTDAGVFSSSKINYPLTPTAMLGSGPAAVTTVLGDAGHDFGVVTGGVARVFGTVRIVDAMGGTTLGAGAEILGVLDSSDTLATNFAVAAADGTYELLLPIDADEGYTIVATDPATGWSDSPCSPTCFLTSADDVQYDIYVYDPASPPSVVDQPVSTERR